MMRRAIIAAAILAAALPAIGQGLLMEYWGRAVAAASYDITPNLRHYYNPGGGSGTNDLGSYPQNVTYVNTVTTNANGWNFDNGNEYGDIAGKFTNGTEYTFTAWLLPDTTNIGKQANGGYAFCDRTTGDDFQLSILASTTNLTMDVFFTDASYLRVPIVPATNYVWTHVAITVSDAANYMKAYINGTLVTNASMTKTPNDTSNSAEIGRFNRTSGTAYYGSIDRVRWYSDVKSDEFIGQVYVQDKAGKGL